MREQSAPADEPSPLRVVLRVLEECFRTAFSSLLAHRLRSFLTVLGIVIGISSVICVIALLQGLTRVITSQFEGLGSNTLTVRAQTPREDALRGEVNRLRATDVDELRLRIDGIANITPLVLAGGPVADVRSGSNVATGQLAGTTAAYQDVYRVFPRFGRFLTQLDNDSRRRVVVLGERIRKDLKLPVNPVGEFVQIGSEWYKVVGLMEARGEIFGQSQDAYLLMPYQTALAVAGATTTPDIWISFSVRDVEAIEDIQQQVTRLLRRLHGLKPGDPNDFVIQSAASIREAVESVSLVITLVFAGIVGISLVVGGVGIMNIMLVSVTERTREIGIAKALGASKLFILLQFLIEAVALALIGGVLGIGFGFALAWMLGAIFAASLPSFSVPFVPWWAVLGALAFSALVGIVFGILPARKAADLAPIDALRYE